ncbi:MAG: hypothetical protein K8I27_00865 [Planctomycetes bacterium]|nr:hypothetical protein [Planctomycetota bacterium]
MDTLVIVRKIREAEALADAGKHGDARRLLEPLLGDGGLTDSHKKLVGKKLDLFTKQQERMTRIISRRATSVGARADESDTSSARTAIREPVEGREKSERPTDLTIEKEVRGQPTEVVPRARDVDTEVPESRGHKLRVDARAHQSSGMWNAISDRREVVRPPDPSDSQELAPVSDESIHDTDEDDDMMKTDIFVAPPDPPKVSDSKVQVATDEESAPTISRYNVDRPVYAAGNDTPAPTWNDTPVPQSNTPAPRGRGGSTVIPGKEPLPVRDSIVVPPHEDLPDKRDDSTYLMAEEYFSKRVSQRQRERSNPELKALADRLPDDDLRRELALEVVKLREELKDARSDRREATRSGSKKIQREDRPESGSFHIPASQVNTIVRRAAGTDQIEVHMPGRDDDAAELQVLRRDSVRGQKVTNTPTDRIALAQDYIDAAQIDKPGLLKPLATYLGVAVVIAVIAWAVYLGSRALGGDDLEQLLLTDQGVADFRLGDRPKDRPDVQGFAGEPVVQSQAAGLIIQLDDNDNAIAIVVPGPEYSPHAARRLDGLVIRFDDKSLEVGTTGAGMTTVRKALGEPTPPFSPSLWAETGFYTLRYVNKAGNRALEFHYRAGDDTRPQWIRLLDEGATPAPFDLAKYAPARGADE